MKGHHMQLRVFRSTRGRARGTQQPKVFAQLGDAAIERLNGSIGSGEHHSTFHHGQNISGQCVWISAAGEAILNLRNAFTDSPNPAFKIFRDQLVSWPVLGIDFQGETA